MLDRQTVLNCLDNYPNDMGSSWFGDTMVGASEQAAQRYVEQGPQFG